MLSRTVSYPCRNWHTCLEIARCVCMARQFPLLADFVSNQHWISLFVRGEYLPRTCYDGALANHPSFEHAFDVGFESGREALLDLIFITQVITFCHGGLIEVREQRCEPLDIVVWLLQQLRDGDWVMKALWESQQHAGLRACRKFRIGVVELTMMLGHSGATGSARR